MWSTQTGRLFIWSFLRVMTCYNHCKKRCCSSNIMPSEDPKIWIYTNLKYPFPLLTQFLTDQWNTGVDFPVKSLNFLLVIPADPRGKLHPCTQTCQPPALRVGRSTMWCNSTELFMILDFKIFNIFFNFDSNLHYQDWKYMPLSPILKFQNLQWFFPSAQSVCVYWPSKFSQFVWEPPPS